jgi:hypothetical protein
VSIERDDPRALAERVLAQQHPVTANWVSTTTRLAELADELADDVSMLTDLDLATWRRDMFAADQPAEVMLNRWVTVADDQRVMLSMRYENGIPDRPFVDASVLGRAPVTGRDLVDLAEAADATYRGLRPRYLRVWSSHPAETFAGTSPDKRFLAAPVQQLRATRLPGNLTARRSVDLSHYDDADAAYRSVDGTHPAHPRQAVIESRDALADTLDRGLLFDVLLDGTWAGYIAARAGGRLGLPGYTVQELVLAPHARGHSLGEYLSPLLARCLPATAGVLIGTIHHHNRGALDAARRAGRIDIGGWFTIPLGSTHPAEARDSQVRA